MTPRYSDEQLAIYKKQIKTRTKIGLSIYFFTTLILCLIFGYWVGEWGFIILAFVSFLGVIPVWKVLSFNSMEELNRRDDYFRGSSRHRW